MQHRKPVLLKPGRKSPHMFKRLLGLSRSPNQAIVDTLYEQIVAAARQPRFYAQWGVPDTPLGRYEMLSLHMFLFLHRARGSDAAFQAVAQELVDNFFTDMDHSLRELGIGDMGVPKRMKKLARMFYGRAQAYGEALEAEDHQALAAAIARNVAPDNPSWTSGEELARYVADAYRSLRRQDDAEILGGRLDFAPANG
jgi:cytochrome b pre-mRNA-processing protein 3